MATKKIPLDSIELEGCQSRAGTCETTVSEYAELWEAKADFPPVTLFSDGSSYFCGDGHHRILGAQRAGVVKIDAQVLKGGKTDALLYSAGANAIHGKRRTNADKRKAVKIVLDLHAEWSDRAIADHCSVGADLVGSVRAQLSENDSSKSPPKRVGKDGKTRSVPKSTPKPQAKPGKISGGTSFDPEEIESAEPPKKPKPKSGKPTISTAGRKAASVALGKLIRALDAIGLYEEFEPSLSQIDERLRNA